MTVTFDVLGIPAPQGSKSAFVRGGRAVVVEGTSKTGRAKVTAWRDAVAEAASGAATHQRFDEPVSLTIRFRMPAVASDPHRVLHAVRPDLDKLIRSTLDGLVMGSLIADDAQVWHLVASKSYVHDDETPGAEFCVEGWGTAEAVRRQDRKDKARRAKRAAA